MALPDGLLDDVKNHLDITWADEGDTKKLTGIISRGMAYLNEKAGFTLKYTIEAKPKELLLEYCYYAWIRSLDQYQLDYLHELMGLKYMEGIADEEEAG